MDLKKTILVLLSAMLIILYVQVTRGRYLFQSENLNFDQNLYAQHLSEIMRTGLPACSIAPSIIEVMPWWYNSPAWKIPIKDMIVERPYLNSFYYHTSFIFYLMVPFGFLFGVNMTLAGAATGIVFSMVLISLWYLRKRNVPWILTLLFGTVVLIHQHSIGVFLGQFYPVRLAIPLVLMTYCLIELYPERKIWPLVIGLAACLCREEVGIYLAVSMTVYFTLFRRWDRGWAGIVLLFAAASVGLILFSRSDPTVPLGTKSALDAMVHLHSISRNLFQVNRLYFLLVNIVGFGFMALFDWRKGLAALTTMLPNMISTIGGAEATGFTTHYHSFYVAAVIWASLSGLAVLAPGTEILSRHAHLRRGVALTLLVLTLGYGFLANGRNEIRPAWFMPPKEITRLTGMLRDGDRIRDNIRRLHDEIRPWETVVCGVGCLPVFDHCQNIFYAPVNLYRSDVVVLFDEPEGPRLDPSSGWKENDAMSLRVLKIMGQVGYDVYHPVKIGRILVFRKKGLRPDRTNSDVLRKAN